MKTLKTAFLLMLAVSLIGCCGKKDPKCTASEETNQNQTNMTTKFQKKYTNADFYTDGKFNQDVALKSIVEMLEFYGVPYTDFMKQNLWVADFGLGDFENTGMGGVFWVNDPEHQYFSHEIYLLPGQMIPEHFHMPTKGFPAKFESWMVRNGWCYNFSVIGDETPNCPALPASQKDVIQSKNFIVQKVGDIAHLKKSETAHFLYAGDEGAIVSEFANYHDGAGLGFTNPKAKN